MQSVARCPACGHELFVLELPGELTALAALWHAPPADPLAPLLLRVSDAARVLAISRSTLYQAMARGDVATIRLGGAVRIPRAEVERLAKGTDGQAMRRR